MRPKPGSIPRMSRSFISISSLSLSPAQLSFTHTHPHSLADNQMVEQLDLQQLARLNQSAGHLDILRAGLGCAAGVVVRDDDRGALEQDRQLEDFTGPDDRRVQTALVEAMQALYLVFGIQASHPELLVVEMPHLQHEYRRQVGGPRNAFIPRRSQDYLEKVHQCLHLFWDILPVLECIQDAHATGRQSSQL